MRTTSLSPAERSLRARIAALACHAQGKTNTVAARAAFESRWDRQVDPDRLLDPSIRQTRAAAARRLYFARLALASSRARAGREKAAA